MSAKKFLLLFLLIFSSISFAAAQDDVEVDKFGRETFNLKFFLPIKPESWTISLTSSGGIVGGTRLLIALNSNGNVICSAKETTYQNRFAPTEEFKNINKLITRKIPYLNFDAGKPPAKNVTFCNDCASETLSIDYRDDKSIRTEHFAVGNFTLAQAQIKEIYQIINELKVCN